MDSFLDSVSLDERQQRCLAELVAQIWPKRAKIKNYHYKLWGDILDNDEIDKVMTNALIIVVMKWDSVLYPRRFYVSSVKQKMKDGVKSKRNRLKREIPQENWQDIQDCSLYDVQERYACEVWQEQLETALYEALTTLNDTEFQAINMYYYCNMSYREIASRLGRTPIAWCKLNHRTRINKLKPAIERFLASSQIH